MPKVTKSGAFFLSVLLATAVLAFADDLALQTGTWEFKMTGMPLDGVPPAMKAQLEAEMSKPYRSCVTPDDIKKLKFGKADDADDEDCKVVSSKLTRTGGDVVRQCDDGAVTQTLHLEAPDAKTLRATITKKTGGTSSTMTIAGKWINAVCKE